VRGDEDTGPPTVQQRGELFGGLAAEIPPRFHRPTGHGSRGALAMLHFDDGQESPSGGAQLAPIVPGATLTKPTTAIETTTACSRHIVRLDLLQNARYTDFGTTARPDASSDQNHS
jgi:hypothetical protein